MNPAGEEDYATDSRQKAELVRDADGELTATATESHGRRAADEKVSKVRRQVGKVRRVGRRIDDWQAANEKFINR